MTLEFQLEQLVEEYGDSLTDGLKNNYLPIIKNAFIPYILQKYSQISDVAYLFTHVVTREDFKEAGINYVDNTKKVTDISAVNKYLSAVGEFCRRIIFTKYPTTILKSVIDFQGMTEEIVKKSQKSLKAKSSHMHLFDADYITFKDYLNELDDTAYKQQVIRATFKMILLYGFKIGIIADINKQDYDENRNILRISTDNFSEGFILELPYLLSREIEKVKFNNFFTNDYLFLTESGQKLSSDYFDYELKNINKTIKPSTKITTTGLAKYAAINMYLEGINPITISQISGMKEVNLNYCQNEAYNILMNNTNRYINSKIRNIHTYDDFNF